MNIVKDLHLKHRLRDPLYGFIRLNDLELNIIDLPIFQRLRRISQLALTKYVYPTAEHSRFVHSLGVLEAVTRILTEILYRDDGQRYSIAEIQQIRLAALLHDIGHLPFSHATEKILLDRGSHEEISIKIIETHRPLIDLLNSNEIKTESITQIIGKKYNNKMYDLISGVFDADRADYLRRDSYMCGVEYGNYDFIRYISSLKFDGLNEQYIINEDDIHTVEAFISARYNYNQQVVYHRTRAGYNIVIREYIKELLRRNNNTNIKKIDIDKLDIDNYIWFDDYTFVEQAKKDMQNMHLNSNAWAAYFLRLKHLKCIDQIHVYGNPDNSQFASQNRNKIAILNDLKNEFENQGKVFVEVSKNDAVKLRNNSNENEQDNKSLYGVKLRYSNKNIDIIEYSPVLKRYYEEHSEIRRYYCKEEDFEEIKNYIEVKNRG